MIGSVALVAGALLAVIGIGAGIYASIRTRGVEESVDVFATANDELRTIITGWEKKFDKQGKDHTEAMEAQEARCKAEIADLRDKHNREIGQLSGQLDALAGPLADRLVEAVHRAAKETHEHD